MIALPRKQKRLQGESGIMIILELQIFKQSRIFPKFYLMNPHPKERKAAMHPGR